MECRAQCKGVQGCRLHKSLRQVACKGRVAFAVSGLCPTSNRFRYYPQIFSHLPLFSRLNCRCVAFTLDAGRCGLADTCKFRTTSSAQNGIETYVKPSQVAANAELFESIQTTAPSRTAFPAAKYDSANKCNFCKAKDYGPCFDEPICRMGKCFQGTALPNGRPCDDHDQLTFDDKCHKGTCRGTTITMLPLNDDQGNAVS